MEFQTTIKTPVSISGVGLHSGKKVNITFKPALENTGIKFVRTDLETYNIIDACFYNVTSTTLSTTISNSSGAKVSTIEHLMAALWGANIDNAIVEINNHEVPILDGSSKDFYNLLIAADIEIQSVKRNYINISKRIDFEFEKSKVIASPILGQPGLLIDVIINFNNKVIGNQRVIFDFRKETFANTVNLARTFVNQYEIDHLQRNGLALGGSLDNAIVVTNDSILNQEGLRYPDEFARHKALDCLGDLYLAGARINGHLKFELPGHKINNKFLYRLFQSEINQLSLSCCLNT